MSALNIIIFLPKQVLSDNEKLSWASIQYHFLNNYTYQDPDSAVNLTAAEKEFPNAKSLPALNKWPQKDLIDNISIFLLFYD